MADIRVKRAYRAARVSDGQRVLVDRLWPRGVAKDRLRVASWMKEIAPTNELRHWFGHEADKWPEFQRRYWAELEDHPDEVAELVTMARDGAVTLVYGAKNEDYNNAVALREYIEAKLDDRAPEVGQPE